MSNIRVHYTVDDPTFDDYNYIEVSKSQALYGVEYLAELCAEQYDNNSNWESASELDFYIWFNYDDEEGPPRLKGSYKVYREWSPTFTAFKK